MKHVLMADDHEVTRRGLRQLLLDTFPGVEITEAANGQGVLQQLGDQSWDIIVLDVLMPGMSVLELLEGVRRELPRVPILMLTGVDELEIVAQTMKAGANGFVHKHRVADDLLAAIGTVSRGGTYLHAETAAAIATGMVDLEDPPHTLLSERELEVFCLIAVGRAVKEAASELGISEKTVATYLARIREKTGLGSHVEIARYALQNGLVD